VVTEATIPAAKAVKTTAEPVLPVAVDDSSSSADTRNGGAVLVLDRRRRPSRKRTDNRRSRDECRCQCCELRSL